VSRVAIIGAGPAGLAAAQALADRGVRCVLFDDNLQAGGQYLRQLPPGFTRPRALPHDRQAARLLGVTRHELVDFRPETTVWAFPAPGTVAFAGTRASGRERVDAIVIAAGAQDRPYPFPGWTLPGVITAGGCLNLIKGQGRVPAGPVVVAGNGPLVLLTAASLLRAGARVVAVAEAGRPSARTASALPGLLAGPRLLAKGLAYRADLLRRGVKVLEGWTVARAEGETTVQHVALAPIGGAAGRMLDASCLVIGYGLQPSTELTRMAGCAHAFQPGRGGWVPVRTAALETSVAALFAVGECAGIGGGEWAMAEGAFVGETVAHRLGFGAAPGKRSHKLHRFRAALDRLYAAALPVAATPDTVLCRCEEVTAAEVEAAVRRVGPDLEQVKAATRVSMGRCQGRNCLAPVADILARAAGCGADGIAWPRMRPPARHVPIAALLSEPLGPARAPDAPALVGAT
jgi:NADPH-dependent 2,4-dienoyl-CoA reductase/sulfur reductase-like enzyme